MRVNMGVHWNRAFPPLPLAFVEILPTSIHTGGLLCRTRPLASTAAGDRLRPRSWGIRWLSPRWRSPSQNRFPSREPRAVAARRRGDCCLPESGRSGECGRSGERLAVEFPNSSTPAPAHGPVSPVVLCWSNMVQDGSLFGILRLHQAEAQEKPFKNSRWVFGWFRLF